MSKAPLAPIRNDLLPRGAWDSHHHIFDLSKYPLAEGRHFTPSEATLQQLVAFQQSLGIEKVCIAHGLSFGYDISSLEDYLKYFGSAARGIAVIDHETISDAELRRLDSLGVKSVRVDFFRYKAMESFEKAVSLIKAVAQRVALVNWSVQIQFKEQAWYDRLADILPTLPTPFVVDHFAFLRARSWSSASSVDPLEQPGFKGITSLLRSGCLWIKLSAPYRVSRQAPGYEDLQPIVRALVDANPHRVLYGSDWPHTQIWENRVGKNPLVPEEFMTIDDEAWITSLKGWLSEDEWQNLFVRNPEALYAS